MVFVIDLQCGAPHRMDGHTLIGYENPTLHDSTRSSRVRVVFVVKRKDFNALPGLC